MTALFVTGASGFVGQHLLRRLASETYQSIYCLSRRPAHAMLTQPYSKSIVPIEGGLHDAEAYGPILEQVDTVVHLAAATGKAKPAEYFVINAEGTERLVRECERRGVTNLLYVSSIAVKFPNKARYYYALSKSQAEEIVRSSRLNYTIVRPTIIAGQDSGSWQGLLQLAQKPFIPVFGDGTAKVQPIDVDDLVEQFCTIIRGKQFRNETLEFGGPESISIEELLKRGHRACLQKEPRMLHLPIGLIARVLSVLERPLYPLLPITVGQLASFRNDGTASPNDLFVAYRATMKSIDEMIARTTKYE